MNDNMNMQETTRLILGLRAAGWDDTKINDFIIYIESGNEEYQPKLDTDKKTTK